MHKSLNLPKPFAELGLEPPVLRGLADAGFTEPTDIQREIIPHILAGRDVLGQARTGTGKTAAFALPILQRLNPQGRLQALILAPTRELAAQIVGEVRRLGAHVAIHTVPVYGGHRLKGQIVELGKKPHVVVGTPGRVLDLLGRGVLSFDDLEYVVLDEVDRMLDIGFRDDIRRILQQVRRAHQTVFVSATLTEEINALARRHMTDPVEVNVSRDELTVEQVAQYFCPVAPWDKYRFLEALLAREAPRLAIIFCNTKHAARKLAKRLFASGVEAKEIHGDLVQARREKVMERFRRHKIPVLVATDLASRGIDVSAISHIINYDLPDDPHVYVHRIGRTARMGAFGKAISLVTPEQGEQLTEIEKLVNRELEKLSLPDFVPSAPRPEWQSPSSAPADSTRAPAAAGAVPAVAAAPPAAQRSLGGKFPVARRRRRRR